MILRLYSKTWKTFLILILWTLVSGTAAIVQGAIVQGDNCPIQGTVVRGTVLQRDFCPRKTFVQGRLLSKENFCSWDSSPRRLLSKEDFCPRRQILIFLSKELLLQKWRKKFENCWEQKKINTNFLLLFLKCRVRPTYGFLYPPLPLADLVQNYFQ